MLIDFQEQLVLSGFNSKYHMMGNSCCNIQIYNHGLKNQMNNLCFNNMLVTMVRWIILVAILWWIILVAAGKYVFPSTTINQNCRHLQAGAPSNMCSKLFPSRDNCSRNIFLIRNELQKGKDSQSNYPNLRPRLIKPVATYGLDRTCAQNYFHLEIIAPERSLWLGMLSKTKGKIPNQII